MLDRLEKLINFVETNQHVELSNLFMTELTNIKPIPLKYIAGALVIAAERNSLECFNVILEYNQKLTNKIPRSFIRAAYSMLPISANLCESYITELTATIH
jgi:hypothetical protein